jgi:hypothetical protein
MGDAEIVTETGHQPIINMTTQTLSEAISYRHQLSLDQLLAYAPDLAAAVQPPSAVRLEEHASFRLDSIARTLSDAEHKFWATFTFGCVQAVAVFCLIYFYFAR